MIVSELIEHLKTLPQDIPVYVREQNPYSDGDYWEITVEDVISSYVEDPETGADIPSVCVGDERV